jgi:hypothetical protein
MKLKGGCERSNGDKFKERQSKSATKSASGCMGLALFEFIFDVSAA